jgi:filamentous hemagglutinin family protein
MVRGGRKTLSRRGAELRVPHAAFASARGRKPRNAGALACALLAAFWTVAPAYAASNTLPTGGSVASGSATINQSGNTLNINQSTNSAIINWQSFSVGRDSTVNFNQPGSSSSTLNRVLGTTPSWIAGHINAPGTVLLINPNGIVITKSGVVNTGSFAASTMNIKDSDYLSGKYQFTGNGNSAAVRNNGRILNTSDGGFVALLGGQVANNGVISARLGKVGLGAGEMATLDLSGDGFLSVAVPSSQLGKLVNADGALVSNKGKIRADGGAVYLSAATAANILRNAVNIPGSVRANSVGTHNGKIVINGGGGTVKIAGRLSAAGSVASNGHGRHSRHAAHQPETPAGDAWIPAGTAPLGDSANPWSTVSSSGGFTKTVATSGPAIETVGSVTGEVYGSVIGMVTAAPASAGSLSGGIMYVSPASIGTGGLLTATMGTAMPTGAVVGNGGTISVAGGNVDISGRLNVSAVGLGADAGNISIAAANAATIGGRLTANSPGGTGGNISVAGGSVSIPGKITVDGKTGGTVSVISASALQLLGVVTAKGIDGLGGRVDLGGTDITIQGASIDASGATGGGLVRIGGTFQGGNGDPSSDLYSSYIGRFGDLPAMPLAQTVYVAADSTINVAARNSGNAGTAIVWSQQATGFAGTIIGTGGSIGGNGGYAEVSSHGELDFTGQARLLAPQGSAGTLLLDPTSVIISNQATTTDTFNASTHTWTPSGNLTAVLNVTDLTNSLANGNVIVTTVSSGNGTGTINVAVPVTWVANTTLSLTANSTISINAAISNINGGLTLTTPSTITTSAAGTINIGTFTLSAGTWTQNAATLAALPSFQATNFVLAGGTGTFLRTIGTGTGTSASPYQIADIYGLQGVGSGSSASSSFVLANNIDAAGTNGGNTNTANWNGGAGFLPIGFSNFFQGNFNGQGFTISGLTISRSGSSSVGLFGNAINGTIQNVNLTSFNVTGGTYVGGLIGFNDGDTISNVTVSGTVTSSGSNAGLLAGYNSGTISNSSSSGTLTGTGSTGGGLVGWNYVGSTVIGSSSSATVNFSNSGGLVGVNYGTISNSSSSGSVAGSSGGVGGLVATNQVITLSGQSPSAALIINSSSSATVTVAASNVDAGGLVGFNDQNARISGSSATGNVNGAANPASTSVSSGGLVGTNNGVISNSFATGNITGGNILGGLVGANGGSIIGSYATGSVTASGTYDPNIGNTNYGSSIGGLVGFQESFSSITNSYASGAVTGVFEVGGLVGQFGNNGGSNATITNSYSSSIVNGYVEVGGLIGYARANNTVSQSGATGTVNGFAGVGGLIGVAESLSVHEVFATGNVSGGGVFNRFGTTYDGIGGLIGNNGATVTNAYATGTVTATANCNCYAGGLIGNNEGSVSSVYAIGAVTGTGATLGALIGGHGVTTTSGVALSNGYWNTDVTGGLAGIGANPNNLAVTGQGENTSTLQSALPSGFSTAYWGIIPGQTYPLLLSQPGVVSGTVYNTYNGAPVGAGVTVSELVNGAGTTTVQTDANGNYLFYLGANGVPFGANVLTSVPNGVSYSQNSIGGVALNIYGTYLSETTSGTSAASLASGLTAALGGNSGLISGLANTAINLTGTTFAIDQSISTGTLVISSTGTVTQSQPITVTGGLALLGAGGSYTLTTSGNAIGTLAANAGTVNLNDGAHALSIGTVAGTAGVTVTSLTLTDTGSVSQTAAIAANTLSLQGTGGSYAFDTQSNTVGALTALAGTVKLNDGSTTLSLGAITATNLSLTDTGTVSQSAAMNVGNLELLGTGGSYALTQSGNVVGTLAASTGAVSLTDSSALTIGTVGATSGVTTTGALTLNVTGTISDPVAAVSAGSFILQSGNWSQNAASLPAFTATDFELQGGSFLRVAGGDGSAGNPYLLTDVYGLQGVTGFYSFTNFNLASNIDASGTVNWNGGAGFIPIGGGTWQGGNTIFQQATFDGKGFTISGLTINAPTVNNVALFGYVSAATIQNLALTGANVTGNGGVGTLGGNIDGSLVSNVSATGTVTAGTGGGAGGLIASSGGLNSLVNAFANVTVNSAGPQAGGLVGSNGGTITNAYATGSVSGYQWVGGLVGWNTTGTITNVYATGNVTGGAGQGRIGGLVGQNDGSISRAFATGNVTQTDFSANPYGIGGLVGWNAGSISQSYYTTGTIVGLNAIGGLVGQNDGGTITDSYSKGATVNGGFAGAFFVGGLVGASDHGGSITNVYAANTVIAGDASTTGALIGAIGFFTGTGATVTNGYWDSTIAAGLAGIGSDSSGNTQTVSGLTTTALQAALPNGFSNTVWGIVPGQTYPFLLSQSGVITGTVYNTYGGVASGAGVTISDIVNGVAGAYTVTTDANGRYAFLVNPNGTPIAGDVFVYTNLANGGLSYQQSGSPGGALALNIYGNYLALTTSANTLSGVFAALGTSIVGNATLQGQLATTSNLAINATGSSFAIDLALNKPGATVVLSSAGSVTQSQAITANGLALLGAGGSYTLTGVNAVASLAANTGSVSFNNGANALSIGTVAGTAGAATTGALTLSDTTTITQTAPITAGTLSLQGGGSYTLSNTGNAISALGAITATTLTLANTGTATQSAAMNVGSLELLGTGATYTLTQAGNVVGTLAANTGNVSLTDSTALTLGIAGGTTGVTLSGVLTLNVTGNVNDPVAGVNVGGFILNGGNWSQVSASLPAFVATNDFELNGGTFLRALGGDGSAATPYLITDIYGFQGIGSSATLLTKNYQLANNIDATGTATWNGGVGFIPVGNDNSGSSQFSGTFDGKNFTINKLTINQPDGSSDVAPFGALTGTIQNLGMTNVSVKGFFDVGGLVGDSEFGTISNSYVTGAVTSCCGVFNGSGTTFLGLGGQQVGGLVGANVNGTITGSYSTATVQGTEFVGGLVGVNQGVITKSYATGNVIGNSNQADPGGGATDIGGLVGELQLSGTPAASVTQSYATGAVSGFTGVGGLVGFTTGNVTVTNVYATGAVTVTTGGTNGGGLIGLMSGGTIGSTYAIGVVSGAGTKGALVGRRTAGTFTANSNYWDITTNPALAGIGTGTGTVTSQTTAQLMAALPANFSDAVWGIMPNQTFPYLLAQGGVISGFAYTNGGATPAANVTVSETLNGVAGAFTVQTDANGAYSFFLGSAIPAQSQIFVSTSGATGGVTFVNNAAGNASGVSVFGTFFGEISPAATLTSLNTVYGNAVAGLGSLQSQIGTLGNRAITAAGSGFAIDTALSVGPTGTLILNNTGTVTQSAAITAGSLALLGAGATYTLTNAGNSIGTLAGNVTSGSNGTISLINAGGFGIGTVGATAGVTAINLSLNPGSNQTVTQSAALNVTNLELLGSGTTYTLTNTSNVVNTLAGTTGSINLFDTSGTFQIATAGNSTGLAATGAVTLTTNTITLNAAINDAGQTLTIAPRTAATTTALGSGTGTLKLTQAALNQITAGTLVFGSTSATAAMTVTGQPINAANITNLTLETGGTMTIAAATTLTDTAANGTITLQANALNLNTTGKVQANAASGTVVILPATNGETVSLAGTGTLNLPAAVFSGGEITANTLQVGNTNSTGGLTIGTTASPTLTSSITNVTLVNSTITVGSGITLTDGNANGTITLQANTLSFGSTASKVVANATSGAVIILPETTGTAMSIAGGSTLNLAASVFANSQITANTLQFGNAGGALATAALTVGGSVTLGSTVTNLKLLSDAGLTVASGATLTDGNANAVVTAQASGFTINGGIAVNNGSGATLSLTTNGAATESGSIAANNLLLLGNNASYTLNGTNTVGTLAASVGSGGSVNLSDSQNLAIGSITANGATTNGVTGSSLTLTDTGTVSQTQAVAVGSLELLGSGGTYTLNGLQNNVGVLAASVGGGSVNLDNGAHNLSIGQVNSTVGVAAATLTLKDTGTVSQTQAIAVTGLELLGAGGTYTLTNSANSVGTLAAGMTGGTINLFDAGNLSIGSVNSTNGVTTGTLNLSFAAGSGVTQGAASNQAINVTGLSLQGSGAVTYALTNASNSIGNFATNVGSSAVVSLAGTGPLSIGTVNGFNGVTATTLTLSETGTVTQSQAITVASLLLQGTSGSYALTNTSNSVGTLAANTGSVNLTDSTALTIGTVAGISNLTATGPVTLTADSITLSATSGLISAAGQTVTLAPYTASLPIQVGGSGSGVFLVTSAQLADITAGTLQIGNATSTGGLTLATSISLPTATFSNLSLVDGGNINVNAPITLNGSSLALNAGGGVAIDNTITVNGAGSVAVTAQPIAGVSTTGLIIAQGASIDYGSTDNGGRFSLNGASYKLVYTMAQLDAIDGVEAVNGTSVTTYGAGLGGNYAIATSLNGAGTTYTQSLIANAFPSFTGSLEGLGHTISGLTIVNAGGSSNGLIGSLGGTVSNIGLVGGSVSGGFQTGALVGQNTGTVQTSYAMVPVQGSVVGGLVGYNNGGTVQASYATGAVSGDEAGGLVGLNIGTLQNSYATGAVMGGLSAGGLVGANGPTSILNSYATGAVTGGISNVGGLVGVGGNVSNGYWDTATSGQQASDGGTGLTTSSLQNGGASGLGSAFGGGANGLYPYLKNFFPNGVQAVAGTAYSDAGVTPLASGANGAVIVSALMNGAGIGSASTGANGYYYIFGPTGMIPAGNNQIAVSSSGATAGVTFRQNASGTSTITGLDIYGTYLREQAASGTTLLSGLSTDYATAVGSNAGALPSTSNRWIDITASSFALDQTVSTGTLVLSAGSATVTQSLAITATTGLQLLGSGATFTLTNASNSVAALAANVGSGTISLTDASATLNIAAINSTTGVTAGTLTLNDANSVTQSAAIAATKLLLQGGGNDTLTNTSNSIGTLAGSVGTLSLTDSTALTVNTVAGVNNLAATGNVTLTANALTLTATTGLISAPGKVVTIAPLTPGTTMGLGTGAGALALNATALGEITASTLVFGSASATGTLTAGTTTLPAGITNLTAVTGGTLSITGTVTDSNANATLTLQGGTLNIGANLTTSTTTGTVVLNTTGTASQTAGVIAAQNLLLLGIGGNYTLTKNNTVTKLAANTGSLSFTDSSALTIDTIAGNAGITATGAVTLTMNSLAMNAGITDPGQTVTLQPRTSSTTMGVGTGSGTLKLTQAMLNQITADTVFFGSTSAGNITIDGAVVVPSTVKNLTLAGDNLTMNATGSITDNNATGTVSLVSLEFQTLAGSITAPTLYIDADQHQITASGAVNVGTFSLQSGAWTQIQSTLAPFSATNFVIGGSSWFTRALGGDSSQGNPYLIADVYGLQGMATLNGSYYKLANDIDASGSVNWNGGAGFSAIGSSSGNYFSGGLDGAGHTISNLYMNQPTNPLVGMFGYVYGGTIQNVTLSGFNVTGGGSGSSTGTALLAAFVYSGIISNVVAGGTVTGASDVGGLVGYANNATITKSASTGTVVGTGGYAGGLVGTSYATISQSYTLSNVNTNITASTSFVGGFAGYIGGGSVTDSYAQGNVGTRNAQVSTQYMGGFIGAIASGATLTNVYSSEHIAAGPNFFGGFAGIVYSGAGTIIHAYFDSTVTTLGSLPVGNGSSAGITAQTKTQLQAGLPAGFSDQIWGIVPTQTYPYLLWQPGVISGVAYSDHGTTPVAAGTTVNLVLDGTSTSVQTVTNGVFSYMPASLPSQIVAATSGATGGVSYVQNATTATAKTNIYGTYLNETTPLGNLSVLTTGLTNATNGSGITVSGLANRQITAAGSTFAIDQAINVGTLVLSAAGTVTQSAPITATNLLLLGGGTSYALNGPGNSVTNLAASFAGGSISLADTGSLGITTLLGTAGVTATTLTLSLGSGKTATQDQTAAISGNLELLGAGASYIFNSTANAVGTLAANTGSVNLTDGSALTVGVAGGTTGLTATGAVTLITNSITVNNVISDANQTVTIAPLTAGTTEALGSGSGTLKLTSTALGRITAGTLAFGSTAGGNMSVTGTLTSTGITNLLLESGGTITIASSTTLKDPTNNGTLTLQANTLTFSSSTTSKVQETGTNGIVAIYPATAGTAVGLANAGGLNLTTAALAEITANTLQLGNAGGTLATGALTVGASASLPATVTNLTLLSDSTITVASGATLTDGNANGIITAQASGFTVNGAISVNNGANATLSLTTTGSAGGTGSITAKNLVLLGAGGSYAFTSPSDAVGTLTASTGVVNFAENGALAVGSTGITATGAVTLGTGAALSIGGAISASSLTLNATGAISDTASVSVGTFTLQAGAWSQINAAASQPAFSATDFRISGGSFLRANGGSGTAADPYTISDLYGLQGMASASLLSKSFALTTNLDATATANWNVGGAGFAPIGNGSSAFTGNFNGRGHTISGLVINRGSANFVGLFGNTNGATISNVGLVGGSITGSVSVGALVGSQNNGTIANTFSTAGVSGFSMVGGLVGLQSSGTVSQSYAAGAVSGTNLYIGGLVGEQFGTVTNSYATGAVTGVGAGADNVGGLVGDTGGTITNSYSVGLVNGSGANVGGLAGSSFFATVTSSVWDTQTSGRTTSAVGTGHTTAEMQDLSSFSTTYSGWDFQTVWAPPNQAGQGGQSVAYYPQLDVSTAVVSSQANNQTRAYGDANAALTATNYGGPGSYVFGPAGDTLTVPAAQLSTAATATSNVGSYAISNTNVAAVTSTDGIAYRLVSVDGTVTVNARAVTVTADPQTKTYGDNNPALTYTTTSLGSGTAIVGALATAATASSDVGTYLITQGSVTNANNPNYAITYVGNTLTIGQRVVTVTADPQTKAYGDANPPLTFTTTSLGAGTAIVGSLATTATASSDVGTYQITQGSVTNANNPNYLIAYSGNTLTINQRAVTVTADAQTRSYGDANPPLTFTTTSLGAGTAILGSLATTATASSDVGTYQITQGSVTNANNPNYLLTYAGNTLTINQRAVTVTADAQTKTYGDNNPALTFTTTSLGAGTAIVGSLTTTATASSDVGTYQITQGSVTNANNTNYAITYVGNSLTIGQRAVTVTADAQTKTYGDSNPPLTFSTTSLGAGTAIAGSLATTGTASSDVGTYQITQGTVTNANNTNYLITYVGNSLTIGQRAVAVTADAQIRIYGDANQPLTFTTTSLGAGTAIAGSLATVATASTDVGTYQITQGSVTNANNPNYLITYAGNTLIINQRAVTVTADAQSKIYGEANPALTFTTTSLGAGTAIVGALTTTATASSDVNTYAITQGSVINANNLNYLITYSGANLSVTPRPITVTANTIGSDPAAPHYYGDQIPTSGAATTVATPGNNLNVGLVNGDTIASVTLSTPASQSSNVGNYDLTASAAVFSTGHASNYSITYGTNAGGLIITPAPLLFTATPVSVASGDPMPSLTGLPPQGFKLNQSAADFGGATWTTLATTASPQGSYAITGGLTNPAPNYQFVQASSNATAFTVVGAGGNNNPSHNPPPSNPPQQNNTNITFNTGTPNTGPINVSFTPPTRTGDTGNNPTTGALPDGAALAGNNGHTFLPIDQFDANQYSDFKLPDYAKDAGEAAIFTMLARGADPDHAADAMIDKFWNGTAGNWPADGALADKVVFSDGNGNTVAPTGNAGFAITAGQTDFAALLKTGPVMISGGSPAHWLLATQMSQDGKSIVANDPATGKQIELAWDPATKTIGGVTGVFDPATKTFTAIADASSGGQGISDLQGFTATNFLAVTVK